MPEPMVAIHEVDHPNSLDPREWSSLLGPCDFFLTREWLAVGQTTAGVPMRYLTAVRDGTAVAGLAITFAGADAPWLLGRPDTLLARCVDDALPGAAAVKAALPPGRDSDLLPGLLCGGRHLGHTRMLLHPSAQRADAQSLVARTEAIARESDARSICFPYVDEHDVMLREVLDDHGFYHHVSGEYATLTLPPGGFAGYLATVSRHRAERIRAERRAIAAADIQTTIEDLTDDYIDRMAELETELFKKHGMLRARPERSATIFRIISSNVGERAKLCLARQDGDIIGFSLMLTHGDQWYAHRGGFDYGRQSRLPLYFETGYYRPIEAAQQYGMTAIHYGVGNMAAKRSRGCTATTQYSYLKWTV